MTNEELADEVMKRMLHFLKAGGHHGARNVILAAINKAVEQNNVAWGSRIAEKDNHIRSLQKECGLRGYYDLYEKIGTALAPQKEVV